MFKLCFVNVRVSQYENNFFYPNDSHYYLTVSFSNKFASWLAGQITGSNACDFPHLKRMVRSYVLLLHLTEYLSLPPAKFHSQAWVSLEKIGPGISLRCFKFPEFCINRCMFMQQTPIWNVLYLSMKFSRTKAQNISEVKYGSLGQVLIVRGLG